MQGLGLERIDLARGRVTAQTLSDGLFQQVKPSLDGESLYVLGFTSSSNPNEPVSRSIWRLDARTLQTKASRPVDNVYSFALATGNPDNNQRAAGQVAFASDQSGVFQIYMVNADGTGLRQMTRVSKPRIQPSLVPRWPSGCVHPGGVHHSSGGPDSARSKPSHLGLYHERRWIERARSDTNAREGELSDSDLVAG